MQIITQVRATLGESPIWEPHRQRFFWVDIIGKKILTINAQGRDFHAWQFEDHVCAIVQAERGRLLVALSDRLAWFDIDREHVVPLSDKAMISSKEMFNDACVDSLGRLWIGTKDKEEAHPVGGLYCFDGKSLQQKASGFIVSNGIDWDGSNQLLYFADSPLKQIYQYGFDVEGGALGERSVLAKVEKGYPDGLTVDCEGRLWGAHWDGSGISCYLPSGNTEQFVSLPAKRTTSCCFGGNHYQTLFVTSASYQLPIDGTHNGHAFLLEGLARGKPPHVFKASR